eukprot:g24581.t1
MHYHKLRAASVGITLSQSELYTLSCELRTKLGLSQQLSQHLRHFAQRFGYASIGWMEEHSCVYAAMATSFHAAEDTLAALDLLPMSETPMQFAVVGLPRSDGKDESEFTVRALTGDVVKLPEAQTVVDTTWPQIGTVWLTTGLVSSWV